MPTRKKKLLPSPKKAANKKKIPGKKPVLKKAVSADSKPPKVQKVRIHEVFMTASGRGKPVPMDILKKEKINTSGRRFQLYVLKSLKKKRLVFYVWEETSKGLQLLPQLSWELKMPDPAAKPEQVPGYMNILQTIKNATRNYADTTLNKLKEFLWSQFGASIDMLRNAIQTWPDKDWETNKRFFFTAYHALFFLDYYLTDPSGYAEFSSSLPFTITSPDKIPPEALDDIVPDRVYTKAELLDYADMLRQKCRFTIDTLTETRIAERWVEKDSNRNYPWLELLLYNMRHVQHHAAQLNMLLRQKINEAPQWISRAAD